MRSIEWSNAPEDAGLNKPQRAQNHVFLGMRAQSGHTRHYLVLHNAMLQSKIVSFDKVGESLDHMGERGGPAVAQGCIFGEFFLGNKRAEKY
jgi:hypothetical protein